jgi:hypothetical protein
LVIERALDAMREGRFDSRLTLRGGDALVKPGGGGPSGSAIICSSSRGPRVRPSRPKADEPHPVETADWVPVTAKRLLVPALLLPIARAQRCRQLQRRSHAGDHLVGRMVSNSGGRSWSMRNGNRSIAST